MEFAENMEHRTEEYLPAHENSSAGSTHKLPLIIEFQKKPNAQNLQPSTEPSVDLSQSQNLTSAKFDTLNFEMSQLYLVSSYSFVLITLGFILVKALYELKTLKNEKKNSK